MTMASESLFTGVYMSLLRRILLVDEKAFLEYPNKISQAG